MENFQMIEVMKATIVKKVEEKKKRNFKKFLNFKLSIVNYKKIDGWKKKKKSACSSRNDFSFDTLLDFFRRF